VPPPLLEPLELPLLEPLELPLLDPELLLPDELPLEPELLPLELPLELLPLLLLDPLLLEEELEVEPPSSSAVLPSAGAGSVAVPP
jgi:hypothetical protein